ncbi:MAG: class I SAM-dependent methyltransferase [Planctomycetes bacterium]|nr:class I SAM-dependent methyltransferase [Planctomycetota bacterium]
MHDPKKRFSTAAGLYHRYRPGYPDALIDWIIAKAGLKSGDAVADIGCGTGISARALAKRGLIISGVDPNEEMLSYARTESAPNVNFRQGSAEKTGLPDHAFAAVTVAQAFHWFDVEPTLAEFARILRSGGRCFAFWNMRTEGPMNDEYEVLLNTFSTEYRQVSVRATEGTVRGSRTETEVRGSKRVRDWTEAEFTNRQVLDWEGFLGRVFSSSYVQHGVADPEGMKRALREHFDRHEHAGHITILYRVEAWCFGVAA